MCAFSVLLSVYKNEIPEHFEVAMRSIVSQTVNPDEIVLIRDGAVPERLQVAIDTFLKQSSIPVKYIPLDTNEGLGNALRVGLEACSNSIVARMDTDDISLPNRFEWQLKALIDNPEVDVIGGQIAEFVHDPSDLTGRRLVPCGHDEIVQYAKRRNPFNHPTVMYKRDSVLRSGNYVEIKYLEDYYLWCRMILNNCRFMNIPETLVYMRVNSDTYQRRGGYRYYQSFKKLERFKRQKRLTDRKTYILNIAMRFIQSVLLPPQVRGLLYKIIHQA